MNFSEKGAQDFPNKTLKYKPKEDGAIEASRHQKEK